MMLSETLRLPNVSSQNIGKRFACELKFMIQKREYQTLNDKKRCQGWAINIADLPDRTALNIAISIAANVSLAILGISYVRLF
jgi:hypothetical protein